MKKLIFLLPLLFLLSCGSPETTSTEEIEEIAAPESTISEESTSPEEAEEPTEEAVPLENSDLYGFYVGRFLAEQYDQNQSWTYFNLINVSIDKVSGKKLEGHSVVAGNNRPFSGTIEEVSTGVYEVEAKEPGDDKYDGVFTFTLDGNQQKLSGTWESYKSTLAVTKRKYELEKRSFKYDKNLDLPQIGWTELYDQHMDLAEEGEFLTDDVYKINPSNTRLTKEDVENMYRGDLEVMRNSIYARHGYSFKNRKMRFVFDRYVDWYIPVSTDIRDELTPLEKDNIDLIKRYEDHADRYYDYFGR